MTPFSSRTGAFALEILHEVVVAVPRGRVGRRTTGIDAIQAVSGLCHASEALFGARELEIACPGGWRGLFDPN